MRGERVPLLRGAIIDDVYIIEPAVPSGPWHTDYCSYTIEIKTNKGTVCISGCHDITPIADCEVEEVDMVLCQCVVCKENGG